MIMDDAYTETDCVKVRLSVTDKMASYSGFLQREDVHFLPVSFFAFIYLFHINAHLAYGVCASIVSLQGSRRNKHVFHGKPSTNMFLTYET